MELGSILQFLENKTILLTGVTGFLAKTFVEKILRVQPNVKKLYLLLRAADATSASYRFHNEVIYIRSSKCLILYLLDSLVPSYKICEFKTIYIYIYIYIYDRNEVILMDDNLS
ncbi:hypothetical protein MANES_04G005501v8 [Manihot esculenta]|uniref:Uncharacterized protein n=1 Tax=Manihot esculenta TaxID=3983 RepID=A0ACB7HRI3_MANES|nr:hypothetical protein MANES_04G005501v8 [Manihot esculenta]